MAKTPTKCPICGKPFKICRTCSENKLVSWKTVCDTKECFDVFLALHKCFVTETATKEDTYKELKNIVKPDNQYTNEIKEQLIELGFTFNAEAPKTETKVETKVEVKPEAKATTTVLSKKKFGK